ncbi:CAP domain-containing protein [Streptomyces sp. Amel2xC10]|uniref:CAP domain-containing protein n=1 Tax=Streptomyces sp. Amel2xC10 TaxID=1305826 RepID=UPI000A087C60|nr:CAP domain-containing protein [Streptomyces sp. Amel2xC10]SMF83249.1 Uncharacterized conserved protein YkwD, contains CAP (CSP/antigen 5/PR1) domain [Streptomyces sp. Amel2xC10]
MGRHRRSAAGRAATGRATGVAQPDDSYPGGHDPRDSYPGGARTMGIAPYLNPEAYAESVARSQEYLYATDWEYGPADGAQEYAHVGAADDYARTSTHDYVVDHGRAYGRDLPPDNGPDLGSDLGRDFVSDFTPDFAPGFGSDDTALFTMDGFAPDGGALRPGSGRGGTGRRRKRKPVTPVKTGLLGVSAAVAFGTVAVATGVVPGLDSYRLGGGSGAGDNVQAVDSPSNSASEFGGTSGAADGGRGDASTGQGTGTATSPSTSTSPSESTASPSETGGDRATEDTETTPAEEPTRDPSSEATTPKAPERTATPEKPQTPATVSAETLAAAEVLRLVNEERSEAGLSPLTASGSLADLAEQFSDDMAARGFFDHTDPEGLTPWDRATSAGVSGLGGENIARGQSDAAAVMDAWMNSPGHKANILNPDFKTLGVGVHFGAGGPWWTQDFGY